MYDVVLQTIQMVGSKMLSLARGKSKRELPLKTSPSTAIHPHVSHLILYDALYCSPVILSWLSVLYNLTKRGADFGSLKLPSCLNNM